MNIKQTIKNNRFTTTAYEATRKSKNLVKFAPQYTNLWVEPGHYYSPIPNVKRLATKLPRLLNQNINQIAGVELNDQNQQQLFKQVAKFSKEMKFPKHKNNTARYFYENSMYAYGDASALYGMLRHFKPRNITEVGSGYSTSLILDVKDSYMPQLKLASIEPYPQRLLDQLRPGDDQKFTLIQKGLEDVDLNHFKKLEANDILFIDSTHVSKLGSDVNYYLFNIFPLLNQGVLIHIHDIPWPFEYSREWVGEGRFWNEAYMLRSFLQYNAGFEIILWPSYLKHEHPQLLKPYANYNNKVFGPGANIWLRKKAK